MNTLEKIYRFLNKEDAELILTGISSSAAKNLPRNYFLFILVNTFTKLGDVLSAPKTVITWIMGALGVPIFLTGLLVPVRESGSMMPQVFIAQGLSNVSRRKKWWIIGAGIQAVSLLGIILSAMFFTSVSAGVLIVFFVATFSLGRALCSLISKDILGSTIPKTRRGKLNGYSSSISGLLVLLSGFTLLFHPLESAALTTLITLVFVAGILWLVAAIIFSGITLEEEKINKKNTSFSFMDVLKKDVVLRKFIIARGLLISSSLMSPFVILLAQQQLGVSISLLAWFILAGGIASVLSGPVWGFMADVSSKKVMVISASIVSLLAGVIIILLISNSSIVGQVWLYPFSLFILGIAHDGVRLGRKTYIVDIAEGQQRTQYVAISNTAIGILLLFVGIFTSWLASLSLVVGILVLMVMLFLGIYFSSRLPEALEK